MHLLVVGLFTSTLIPSSNTQTTSSSLTDTVVRYVKTTIFDIPEDADLTITQLIEKYRYVVEVHNVTTKDGYLLQMHRIPRSRRRGTGRRNATRDAVLVMHGLFGSSDDWVVLGPNRSLGYVLADAGYDVWLGNTRGSRHSRRHVDLSPHEAEYWNYSLDELALYDLKAMIDYVLNATNSTQLFYTGFSQGTTIFLILCSRIPEYNEKIRYAVLLSPVAFLSNAKSSAAITVLQASSKIHFISSTFGNGEFIGDKNVLFREFACNSRVPTQSLCTKIIFQLSGYDEDQVNQTMVPVIAAHFSLSCSTKQLAHFGQMYSSGHFRSYDYGWAQNLDVYSSPTPPDFDLEAITAPITLVYAKNDLLSVYEDVEKLYHHLPNVIEFYPVPYRRFNHGDFIWANDVKPLLNDKVVEFFGNFTIEPNKTANIESSTEPLFELI